MGLFMRPRRQLVRMAVGATTGERPFQPGARNDDARVPSAPAVDTTAEIERLAKLHQSGVLDDAEFAAAKSRLLGT